MARASSRFETFAHARGYVILHQVRQFREKHCRRRQVFAQREDLLELVDQQQQVRVVGQRPIAQFLNQRKRAAFQRGAAQRDAFGSFIAAQRSNDGRGQFRHRMIARPHDRKSPHCSCIGEQPQFKGFKQSYTDQ